MDFGPSMMNTQFMLISLTQSSQRLIVIVVVKLPVWVPCVGSCDSTVRVGFL